MKKSTKTLVMTAIFLILAGCMIFAVTMTVLGWDFAKLSGVKYENTYVADGEFKNISVSSDTDSIEFILYDGTDTKAVCRERRNVSHSLSVADDTLYIKTVDRRKWYEYLGISFGFPKVTVYLPQKDYGDLFIESKTGNVTVPEGLSLESADITLSTGNVSFSAATAGDISVKTSTGKVAISAPVARNISVSVSTGSAHISSVKAAGDITVRVSTGDARIADTECKDLVSCGSTGDLELCSVIASGKFSLERSTGDISFDGCDASEIFAETSTGDIEGSLLSSKVFIVSADTGDIDVPKTITGGRCELTTDTGDIEITTE